MSSAVTLTLIDDGHGQPAEMAIDVQSLVIAGWTGRDADAIEAHIAELEAIGVPRPKTVPCFYRVAASLLTSADVIEVPGNSSSGEVEFVLFASPRGMLVGVGSDHTDRHVETYSITVSKQMCAKPIALAAWRHADVAGHWDELILRSWAVEDGVRRLYQEGLVAAMRTPEDLIARHLAGAREIPAGTAMYCGTLAVHGEIASAGRFEFEIEDPVLNRRISHGYDIRSLPIED